MQVIKGVPASPGVVFGPALVLGSEDFRIPQVFVSVDAVETEIARFQAALDAVSDQIEENEKLATERLGSQYGAIFAAHLQLVHDRKLISEIETLIREHHFSPEFASSRVLRKYAKEFQNLGNHYLAERADDIFDLKKRILRHLLGERREELAHLTAPMVVLANNLTPSETARLKKKYVLGFATEAGGHTSHTAILAGALEIPAVVGLGDFLTDVSGGETVIIDGHHGEVIIDPDEETLARYRDSEAKFKSFTERMNLLHDLSSETKDGIRIQLMGNIEFPEEVEHCTQRGADGIGLYRTEFLYLEKETEPTEEDHYEAYCKVAKAFPKKPVVIRTLDLGADKVARFPDARLEDQPSSVLGLRSIRLSLRNQPLFKTQLRAILRAALHGEIRIMFPLIATMKEFRQAKMILADVIEDLQEQGIPFQKDVPVGMMVEVPSAAILAGEFAKEVDFFSIGTNDLIQYTLAADRSDPSVANLYSPADPSILRLMQTVIEAGEKENITVNVCGQMSSDAKYIPLLIGLGLRRFSVTPHTIPEVKDVIRNIDHKIAVEIAQDALEFDSARDVENFLVGHLKKLCPNLFL